MKETFFIREFFTEYKNGKGVDYVVLSPRGESADRIATPIRVKDITPPEHVDTDSESGRFMVARWAIIGPAYEAWKAGNKIPEDGTPLGAWSAISPSQADFLKRMGCTTVEHVSQLSPEATAKLPWPDSRKLPALAADFLRGIEAAERIAENEALRERIAVMEEMIAAKEEAKRGPGRPKKETEAA